MTLSKQSYYLSLDLLYKNYKIHILSKNNEELNIGAVTLTPSIIKD